MDRFKDKQNIEKIASVINNSSKLFQEFHLLEKGGTEITGVNETKPKSYAQRLLDEKSRHKNMDDYISAPRI